MSSNTKHSPPPPFMMSYETSPSTNTTYVHVHPSTFRAVVQHLTGSTSSSSDGQPQPSYNKLHERRQQAATMKKLEMIKLSNSSYYGPGPNYSSSSTGLGLVSPVSTLDHHGLGQGGFIASPRTPAPGTVISTTTEDNEDLERAAIIAEKGFYNLHPGTVTVSPLHNLITNFHHHHHSRDYCCNEPQLLPLFPLHSPRDHHH